MFLAPAVHAVLRHGGWRPGTGDPTTGGWLITGGYLVSAILCVWARESSRKKRSSAGDRFWVILAAALFALGINKQLDLQTWFWHTGRAVARMQGWYEYRRPVQYAFLFGIGLLGVVLIWWLSRIARPVQRAHAVALVGIALLLSFVLLRVVSIHPVDVALATRVAGASLKDLVESVGILLTSAGAVLARPLMQENARYWA